MGAAQQAAPIFLPPRPPGPLAPPRSLPSTSLVASEVMKHPATGSRHSGRAASPARPAPGRPAMEPPAGATSRHGGSPTPVRPANLPANLVQTENGGPRAAALPEPEPRAPSESPSLSLHPASPTARPRAGEPSGALPHAGSWESGPRSDRRRPPPRPLRYCRRRRRSRPGPRASRCSASPGAFSCVAPSRQASKQAGGVSALGRERARGPANAAAAVAAESARSAFPVSAPRGPAPVASWREPTASHGPGTRAYISQHATAGRHFRAAGRTCAPGCPRGAWSPALVMHVGMGVRPSTS